MVEDFDEQNTIWTWTGSAEKGFVWSLEHIRNAVYGDTDSIYISLNRIPDVDSLSVDDLVDVADSVGETINDAFPDFCMHAFNCPEERKDIIQTARETVASSSLFLSKKRYALQVIDDEGKRVNKIKMVGLEIKKSNESIATKRFLTELVMMILEGKEMEEVLSEVDKMKEVFMELPVNEISKPISVKTLKKCEDVLETTGDKKGFPYQVRASMFWNENCRKEDRKIMSGEKVGLLYIKHVESKYIAFPIDMTIFPDWFHEFKVDYDTEWEKTKNKLVSYLSSMGWDTQSQKNAIVEDLFGF